MVSIPKRVSEALKLEQDWKCRNFRLVSIPKRVSEALKLSEASFTLVKPLVSIPKRVSEALKQLLGGTAKDVKSRFNP